ncbi:MAG: hypothetical protein KGZ32_03300, partial [Dethiobacter sp.]|nr:hypothetical protein [Dethiobacter sp.]
MRKLPALIGIMRNEILLQFKTKLFVMSLINSIVVVILFGYLAGLQAQPMNHLRVGVIEGTPPAEILTGSEKVKAIVFADAQAAEEALRNGEVIASVLTPAGDGGLTVLIDDTQGA